MSITIYAVDKTTLKYTLAAVQASRLHQSLNGECTYELSMPARLIRQLAIGDEIRLGDLFFDVVRIGKSAAGGSGAAYSVSCEHISYELADIVQDPVHYSGEPADVLAEILAGTGFSVGTVTVTGDWSITINRETNRRDALQQWATACGAELTYTGRAVNFLAHAGSSSPVALSEKENVKSLSVTLDSRSDTQTYAVELSRLQHLALGDAITITYTSLNINTTTRIISLDFDPFHPWAVSMTTGDFVPDFTNAVTAALEARVAEGVPYFGVSIDKETGLKIERSDGASQAVFNSDVFAMRALIDDKMRDRIYFDPIRGDYVFDGALGADAVFTASLYAETGDVAELTVDRLSTSRRIRKYILGDTGDDNYVKIEDQYIRLMTGTLNPDVALLAEDDTPLLTEDGALLLADTNGAAQPVQAVNRYGDPLYWQREPVGHTADGYPLDADGVQIYATTEPTEWRVYVYSYTEMTKAAFEFDDDSGTYIPTIILGAGDELGRSQGYIRKDTNSLDLWYTGRDGDDRGVYIAGDYVDIVGLRKTTEMDFSGWDNGGFSETIDGDITAAYTVDFDGQGRPVKITDGVGHETVIVWEASP